LELVDGFEPPTC